MADALASGASEGFLVGVQVPPRPPRSRRSRRGPDAVPWRLLRELLPGEVSTSGVLEVEALHEVLDVVSDVVADGSHGLDRLTGGVVELPVFVALPGEDRAGVAAPH